MLIVPALGVGMQPVTLRVTSIGGRGASSEPFNDQLEFDC